MSILLKKLMLRTMNSCSPNILSNRGDLHFCMDTKIIPYLEHSRKLIKPSVMQRFNTTFIKSKLKQRQKISHRIQIKSIGHIAIPIQQRSVKYSQFHRTMKLNSNSYVGNQQSYKIDMNDITTPIEANLIRFTQMNDKKNKCLQSGDMKKKLLDLLIHSYYKRMRLRQRLQVEGKNIKRYKRSYMINECIGVGSDACLQR
jgi:hypothetical protein